MSVETVAQVHAELLVGYDHRFGRGRSGDAEVLRSLGARLGFGVDVLRPVQADGERPISSTLLRRAVAASSEVARNERPARVLRNSHCSALMATSLYVVQRTCHVRLISDGLAAFVFWGWQLVILAAAVSLPLGYTQGKEYAELEWPIDILITLVWVAYGIVFFGTLALRGFTRRGAVLALANTFSNTVMMGIPISFLGGMLFLIYGFIR